jgi:MFS family permease
LEGPRVKAPHEYGIIVNRAQVAQQVLQVAFVGLTLGLMRTVVPALAEEDFGVPRDSFLLLATFVVAFGVVKGAMNFAAGHWAEHHGRRRVLLAGWIAAWPIPLLLYFAPDWNWVVAATVLLGVSQGMCWSMTQTSMLDLTSADERGLAIGINEFAGYAGMALAGLATGWLAHRVGSRAGLLYFGVAVIGVATLMAWRLVAETRDWVRPAHMGGELVPSTREAFVQMSWTDRRMFAVCQAGLVEKFVDALVWIFWPVFLYRRGLSLPAVGVVVGWYGFTWGIAQLFTGRLSDRFGRMPLNVGGMWLCALGVGLWPLREGAQWWSLCAALTGLGMALLYPNLSAAIADLAPTPWRATAIGIYRFWRDLGYAIGAFAMGAVAWFAGDITPAFWFVAASMSLSGAMLWIVGRD